MSTPEIDDLLWNSKAITAVGLVLIALAFGLLAGGSKAYFVAAVAVPGLLGLAIGVGGLVYVLRLESYRRKNVDIVKTAVKNTIGADRSFRLVDAWLEREEGGEDDSTEH